ncbi:MAG: transketolase [Anaerolineales bacterium]|nr:transketolase [Anaerolineales bacterium]
MNDMHNLAANTVRVLTMDAVQNKGDGHPGMPMGMADVGVVLWREYLRHNPQDAGWIDRDRFVLSAGHGSMLLYSLLHLTGYPLPLEEIKHLRQWGSKTPGHPEYGHTVGVETTTGPLGQGVGNAVGMAIAEKWLAEHFNQPDFPVFDHFTYVIAGDGDLMEGISHEAASLAGHLGLGKLILFYDDNHISIDGPTDLTFSEDIPARFAAYGWHTQSIDGHDPAAIRAAIEIAKAEGSRPSIIACRTKIGFGSPNKENTSSAHGSALGEDEVRLAKQALGFDPEIKFHVPDGVYEYMVPFNGTTTQSQWEQMYAEYRRKHTVPAARLHQALHGELPAGWDSELPRFDIGTVLATRACSGKVLAAAAEGIPYLVGGSADLSGSNLTKVSSTEPISRYKFGGRYIHYGIREHAMGAIMNGLALHGGIRPYGGTFLVFSDYMRPSVRLAALMGLPVIYVFTHDGIGVGEDGPTHQPVEHTMSLRLIPNLHVIRPADGKETIAAWRSALERKDGPTALILSRQGVPTLAESLAEGAMRGGYVLRDSPNAKVALIGTGTELSLAVKAQEILAERGIPARVVSLPSWELFAAQDQGYRDNVLPPSLKYRVAVEAGQTLGWERYVGDHGHVVGLDHFGASAPYKTIYEKFGITAEAVADAATQLVSGQE